MANVLGSLFVELKANTAAFVSGMSAASYSAKKAGRDIEDSFSRLGSIASSAFSPLGEVGQLIGETFSRVGEWGASASDGIAHLAGGMSPLTVGAGSAVAAIAALDAVSIGLTIHFAEQAAKLAVLSQQTGVSVESLSSLGFVAKQSGVDQEIMTQGLTRMSKSLFAAATAAPGAANAYSRLGISVRDSGGNVRDAGDVFADVAERFHGMQDGSVKTALAIQLFGRSGAQLIPVLNQGREGIAEWTEVARELGIVIDTQTAEAAHKFEQSTNEMSAAMTGLGLKMMKDLLPSLQIVAASFVEFGKELNQQGSAASRFIDFMAWLVKVTISVGETFWTLGAQIGLAFEAAGSDVLAFADQLGEMWDAMKKGDFSGVEKAFESAGAKQRDNLQNFMSKSKDLWAHNADFIESVMGPKPPSTLEHRGGGGAGVDTSHEKADKDVAAIEKKIASLRSAADAELALAATTSQSLAAQKLQNAEGEASQVISELVSRAWTKEGAERQKLLDLIMRETASIRALTAEKQVAKDAVQLDQELAKESNAFMAQIAVLSRLSEAYSQGGAAIAAAEIEKKLESQKTKIADLNEEYDRLAVKPGVSAEALAQISIALDEANGELNIQRLALERIQALEIDLEIDKATAAFRTELPALEQIQEAYFGTAEAARNAAVEMRVAQFRTANPGASEDQISRIRSLEQQKSDQAFDNSTTEEAARMDLLLTYDREVEKLDLVRAKLQDYGRSTLLVDAALYDANDRMIRQWDEAVAKVGSFSERFRGLMNELALEGKNFSGKFFEAFHKGIDDAETQLAKFIVTGKANFKEVLQSMEESIVKAGIQKAVGAIGGFINQKFFGGAIPGLGTKADGSMSAPFYVHVVDSGGGIMDAFSGGTGNDGSGGLGGLFGGGGDDSGGDSGGGGLFGGIFSKLTSSFSSIFSSIGGIISKVAGGIGSVFSSIFSMFGGFLAGGGDVTPGKAYVVGEKHPEFFVPRQAGHVAPSLQMGSGPQQYVVNMHIHGVKDADSFRRSQGQIHANIMQSLSIAHARNK